MRDWINIIEATAKEIVVGSAAWRRAVLALGRDEEQSVFTVLRPEETGLKRSVFISGWKNCPAFIVDAKEGTHFEPSPGSKVYMFGEKTGKRDIDRWFIMNKDILLAYCAQKISSLGLDKLRPINGTLHEMANFSRGDFGVPLAFFVRPEPRPLQHSARVKVNNNYQTGYDPIDNFSIRLFPNSSIAPSHHSFGVKQKDCDGMVNWIEKNKTYFWDFINGTITRDQLNKLLTANPYP